MMKVSTDDNRISIQLRDSLAFTLLKVMRMSTHVGLLQLMCSRFHRILSGPCSATFTKTFQNLCTCPLAKTVKVVVVHCCLHLLISLFFVSILNTLVDVSSTNLNNCLRFKGKLKNTVFLPTPPLCLNVCMFTAGSCFIYR